MPPACFEYFFCVCVKKYHRVSEPFSKERKDVHLLRRLRVLLISITPSGFIKFDAKYFFIIIAFEFTHINNETANLKKKTSIVRFVVLPTRCDSSSLANRLKLLFFITASRQNKQKEKKTGFRQRSSFCHHRLSVAKEVGVRESRGGNGRCLLARARSENAILKKQKIRAQSEIEKLSLSFHHLVETK